MWTGVRINDIDYPAEINGRMKNSSWDGRETKEIVLSMDYATAVSLFQDNTPWSIVEKEDEQTEQVFDNSDYCLVGDITTHRDGTISVLMGKPTELELLQAAGTADTVKEELKAAYLEGVESNG